jgi:hypothetical protein
MNPNFQGGWGGQPSFPPMGMPMAYSMPQPFPQGGGSGRGRGRGRGGYANTPRTRSLVPQIKEESRMATAGQLLELARYFTATLSRTDATLYGQFLAGLGRGDTVKGTSQSSPDTNVSRMIVADRKKKWKELCTEDHDVTYWQEQVDRIKKKHGAQASVDEIVLNDESVDVRRYQLGKQHREKLLTDVGLTREGSNLRPLVSDGTSSDVGDIPKSPSTVESKKKPYGTSSSMQIEEVTDGDDRSSPSEVDEKLDTLTGLVQQLTYRLNAQMATPGHWGTGGGTPYPPQAYAYPHGYAYGHGPSGLPQGQPPVPHGTGSHSGEQKLDDGTAKPLPDTGGSGLSSSGSSAKKEPKPESVPSGESSPLTQVKTGKP